MEIFVVEGMSDRRGRPEPHTQTPSERFRGKRWPPAPATFVEIDGKGGNTRRLRFVDRRSEADEEMKNSKVALGGRSAILILRVSLFW
jgi:hypothetical protein